MDFEKTKTTKDRENAINSIPLVGTYPCTAPYALTAPELWFWDMGFHNFNFNSNDGRFVFAEGGGYVNGDGDSINVSYGTCDKFD